MYDLGCFPHRVLVPSSSIGELRSNAGSTHGSSTSCGHIHSAHVLPNVRCSKLRGPTSVPAHGVNMHPHSKAPYPSNRRCCHGHPKLERQCILTNNTLASFPLHHYIMSNPVSTSTTPAAPVSQSVVIAPCPIQMPLSMLQAYLRVPPVTTHAFHSSTVPPVTPATAATSLAVSPIRTADLSSEEGVENIETRAEPRPVLPHGPETVSIAEQTGRGMGDSPLYGLTGMTYGPAKFAQNNAHDKSFQIPGRLLPPPATLFGMQSMPRADGLGHFARICAPPRANVAAATARAETRPS
ncbi:hypothetical protein FS749_004457 [Ceratobasidium sp. UAMH 11750]|nr:hypothetical protein FS749_004457 [Ceratobasidium sp. UAMH 11750]